MFLPFLTPLYSFPFQRQIPNHTHCPLKNHLRHHHYQVLPPSFLLKSTLPSLHVTPQFPAQPLINAKPQSTVENQLAELVYYVYLGQ